MKKDRLQPQRCARLLGALAAPDRLRIVRHLLDGPRNVTQVAEALRLSVVKASHHLHVLRNAGLVRARKRGRFVLYSLAPGVLHADDTAGEPDHINLGCCRLELPRTEPGEEGERRPD